MARCALKDEAIADVVHQPTATTGGSRRTCRFLTSTASWCAPLDARTSARLWAAAKRTSWASEEACDAMTAQQVPDRHTLRLLAGRLDQALLRKRMLHQVIAKTQGKELHLPPLGSA
eukprot:jgi/Pico_ML_1/51215/g2289.t1